MLSIYDRLLVERSARVRQFLSLRRRSVQTSIDLRLNQRLGLAVRSAGLGDLLSSPQNAGVVVTEQIDGELDLHIELPNV